MKWVLAVTLGLSIGREQMHRSINTLETKEIYFHEPIKLTVNGICNTVVMDRVMSKFDKNTRKVG